LSARKIRRELLKIDGQPVPVTVRINPRARRLIVKVHPSTGEVCVVARSSHALNHALDYARDQSDWIAKRLADVPPRVVLEDGARVPFRGEDYRIVLGGRSGKPVTVDEDARTLRVSGRTEHVARRLLDFFKREARAALEARVIEHAGKLGITPKRITVRDTASRWGSCSSSRSLSFSWRLIMAPDFVLDYVVAHEAAHLREMNHGPRFWRLVELLVGDGKRAQRWLNRHGARLHSYAPRG
jgi:hypothetical protein